MRRYLVSVDLAMRTADRETARKTYQTFLNGMGLETGLTVETSGYEKSEVKSRVFGTAAIFATDFSGVAARLRRLDAAIFDCSPAKPSPYFKLLRGDPQGVEIVGPSPDDPIAHAQIVWVNIEAQDSDAWQQRLAPLHDEDSSADRDDRFRR